MTPRLLVALTVRAVTLGLLVELLAWAAIVGSDTRWLSPVYAPTAKVAGVVEGGKGEGPLSTPYVRRMDIHLASALVNVVH
jgi:hypothetical protein